MTDSSLGWPWSLLSPFSQTIGTFTNDPSTNWQNAFSPEIVFNLNKQDAPVEAQVLSRVGSYGKQLGTLIHMIDILQRNAKLAKLEPDDAAAITAFDALRDDATKAVADYRGKILPDHIADAFEKLKMDNPEGAKALLARLAKL